MEWDIFSRDFSREGGRKLIRGYHGQPLIFIVSDKKECEVKLGFLPGSGIEIKVSLIWDDCGVIKRFFSS